MRGVDRVPSNDGHVFKRHWSRHLSSGRSGNGKNSLPNPMNLSSLFLDFPSPRIARELRYFISEEDYVYFVGKTKDVLQEDTTKILYHMCKVSAILDFEVVSKCDILVPEFLQKEKRKAWRKYWCPYYQEEPNSE